MKPTKWTKRKLTQSELSAQKLWRNATGQRSKIVEALMSCDHYMNRDAMHKRLDRRLDAIERQEAKATSRFPEVEESFTMFTDTIVID